MRKVNKVTNIALIFMLIGAMLYLHVAYSADTTCLRVPAGMNNRAKDILGRVSNADDRIRSDVESYYLRQKEKRAVYYSDSFDVPTGFLAAKCHQYVMGDVKRPPFELDPNLEAYMEHLGQLSDEELDREFVNVSGVNLVLSRCSYNDFSLVQYDSAGILKKGAIGQEREKALKIVLIFGEWGKRYYRYEQQYGSILPSEFAVIRRYIDVISHPPFKGYDYRYEKEYAVEVADVTDKELNRRLEGLAGREYDLRQHTCEDIFFDVYRPIMEKLGYILKMCQKGELEESAYQELQVASRKIKILLEEWFRRHAWLQDASLPLCLPSRKKNLERAFCAESFFEQSGIGEYFHLYRCKICNTFRRDNSRDFALLELLKKLDIGKGGLLIDIGSGRNYDWVKFAALMGLDAIATDIKSDDINKAKRKARKELLLRRDLLPSEKVKLREAYRRIKWIGGEAGDIAKLNPSKRAKVVVMEGFIDAVLPLSCFGSIPIYSDKQRQEFLEKAYQLLGEEGYLLVSIYAREKYEFTISILNFIDSKIGRTYEDVSFPLSTDSPWFDRDRPSQMFVIHVKKQHGQSHLEETIEIRNAL